MTFWIGFAAGIAQPVVIGTLISLLGMSGRVAARGA